MRVYDIIEMAESIRPGNTYDTDIIERWINELDSMIQIEVCKKSPSQVRNLKPDAWVSNRQYIKGDRVSVTDGGKIIVYVANKDHKSEIRPSESDNWTKGDYDTYVGHPHDRLYYLYVICMMDYANREYDKYANDKALYDEALNEFAKWWQRKYRYSWEEGIDEYELEIRPTHNG